MDNNCNDPLPGYSHALFSFSCAAERPKAYLCEAGSGRSACIADLQLAKTETAAVECSFHSLN
jgi:hypothetical protein